MTDLEFQQKMFGVLQNCGALSNGMNNASVDYAAFVKFLDLSETQPQKIEPSSEAESADPDDELQEGDLIEARYGGKEDWYPGKISTVCGDSAYNIKYDDGDTEYCVQRQLIRRRDAFKAGDNVEARFGGKEQWYPGKIACSCGRGLYDITYSDGDSEKGVKVGLIRAGKVDDEPLSLHPVLKSELQNIPRQLSS